MLSDFFARKTKRRLVYHLLLSVVIACIGYSASFAETNFFSHIAEEPQIQDPFEIRMISPFGRAAAGGEIVLEVVFSMPPGYKLFSDQIKVELADNRAALLGQVVFPPFILMDDPYIGKIKVFKGEVVIRIPLNVKSSAAPSDYPLELNISYQGCSETKCFMPKTKGMSFSLTVISGPPSVDLSDQPSPVSSPDKDSLNHEEKEKNPFQKAADRFGLIGVVLAAFIWGFLASLTPCVYPMIPVTMSVIGAGSAGSAMRGFLLSSVYVLGLSLTYAIMGTIAALTGGLFGELTGSPVLRVFVSALFVLMALSMFDIFFVQMPSSISSKLQKISGKGFAGVFLVGAVAGLVVGPCVGPMLVSLLVYVATLGNIFQGFFMMWSFALGLGLLFLVIGTFSGILASLPKAGAWMEKVKYLFGMMMFGVALYFVKPLISENIYMLSVGMIFLGTGVFSGGFDKMEAASPVTGKLWKTIGVFFLLWGASIIYQVVDIMNHGPQEIEHHNPLIWQEDEASALSFAKEQNRPLLIDFYAEWCASCKKLEQVTFSDEDVRSELGRFDLLRVDATDSNATRVKHLLRKYNVIGLPTIIFVNASGDLQKDKTITDYVSPKTFLETIRQVQ
ncbi:MAG: protein-disulfide reductase DsbD [Proteobacteria bacterium]|nr:protein-disulfide reductase DsbD [Pseudomonadota bacterium]